MSKQIDEMYRDIIMEHYRFPRGKKDIPDFDIINEGHNPTCGDELELKLKMNGDKISGISIDCAGCAISTASGSMLAEVIEGRTLEEAKQIAKVVKALLKGEKVEKDFELGDLEALRGVQKFPVRIKCALLSWTTLIDAIESQDTKNVKQISTTE